MTHSHPRASINVRMFAAVCAGLCWTTLIHAQSAGPPARPTFPTTDSILRRIWRLGTDSSMLEALAQPFLDSIGPRLDGSPGLASAREWVAARYREWDVSTRIET